MYLQKQLARQFSGVIRARGADIHGSGRVTHIAGDRWQVRAKVRGSRVYQVELWRQDDQLHVYCTCAYFDTESVCKHIWATILAADEKCYLLGAMGGSLLLVEDYEPRDFELDEEGDEEEF